VNRTLGAADVTVVIPTRDRWPVLQKTLDALACQTVDGFETIVVVDGLDQEVPPLDGVRVLTKEHGGPGAARNAGVGASCRPIVLFLGDDMVPAPDLVQRHLQAHRRHPQGNVGVLGTVEWHPEVRAGALERWLDWSGTQFDFGSIGASGPGFWHFYSCNVSLERELFADIGGFNEAFTYYYEDLDCGYRLHQKGMRLLYEPGAVAQHLHGYDWAALERRFRGVAQGEHVMTTLHPWFEPFFLGRVRTAIDTPVRGGWWPWLAERSASAPSRWRERVRSRADAHYHQRLAPAFLGGWAGAADLSELRQYLGDRYDRRLLMGHEGAVDDERRAAPDEASFYRTSEAYLYDLTVFAMSGTKAPYLNEIRSLVPQGGRLLDYGCGIGADGLRLAADGYRVELADFANPSTAYLRWRLARRGWDLPVYDLDRDEVPGGFDAAYAWDVIEHVDEPFEFLRQMERRAALVAVNLLEEDSHDTALHRPLPIRSLLDHAAAQGLVRYRRYHGRSHLVIYRSKLAAASTTRLPRVRSRFERHVGAHLPGRPPWYPVPAR
jgi:hypothetical protein